MAVCHAAPCLHEQGVDSAAGHFLFEGEVVMIRVGGVGGKGSMTAVYCMEEVSGIRLD